MQGLSASILLVELCTEDPEEDVCNLFYAQLEFQFIWVLSQCCCIEHRTDTFRSLNINVDIHHVNCWACWLQHQAATQPPPPRSYTVFFSLVWFWNFLQSWSLAWWDYDRRKDPSTWRGLVCHPPAGPHTTSPSAKHLEVRSTKLTITACTGGQSAFVPWYTTKGY